MINFVFGETKRELSIENALKTDDNCMGDLNITNILQNGLQIIMQNCLKDDISLSDDDIKVLIRQSLDKLCAVTRFSKFHLLLFIN